MDSSQSTESFRDLLLRHRGRTGLSQRELADRIGAGRRTVQDWEAGVNHPSAERLQALIQALLDARGLTVGREAAEAQQLWAAVMRDAPRMRTPFDEVWLAKLLAERGGPDQAAAAPREVSPEMSGVEMAEAPRIERDQDWDTAPDVLGFVGRAEELVTLGNWVLDEHCRLVAVLGMGGIGKTMLAARLAQNLAPNFGRLYWRSLRDALPINDWLAGVIGFLSGQQMTLPEGEGAQLRALLELLRDGRNLLVLDNFETLLQPGDPERRYREGYAGYGRFLRAIGEGRHQSCLLVTSRESPPEFAMLGDSGVRSLQLRGLGVAEGQVLLAGKGLSGSTDEWSNLIERFGGNGLALKVVGESIRELFGGELSAFLNQAGSPRVFGGIRRLLAEQLENSSVVEQNVLRVLAVEREPMSIPQLIDALRQHVSRRAVLEAVEALHRRSLVERAETAGPAAFTLQSVALEYVTDRLVEQVSGEISGGQPVVLLDQPLVKALAKDYVRQTQERLIGEPILQQVQAEHGSDGAARRLLGLLDEWRDRPRAEQGYGPGNVVNLLRLMRRELHGLNLAGLALRQAYLAGVEAHDASLANADLAHTVLTETFNSPLCVALSPDGEFLAAGTSAGEVCVWRVADRTPLLMLQAHNGPVHGVALGNEGRLMASASEDGTVRLWEAASGHSLGVLAGHTSPVYGVALSTDGRLLASGGFDGTTRLWDVSTRQLVSTLEGHPGGVWSVAFSGDSHLLASGCFDGSIGIWDVITKQQLAMLDGHGNSVWSVRLSHDGELLATGTEDSMVRLWEVSSGRLLATLQGHTGSIRGVALSRDRQLLASASWDGTVRLWELPDGQPLAVLEGHAGPVRGVALGDDGRLLASGSLDGSVRLWEAPAGRALTTIEGHTSPVYGVALSADGRLIASGSWDGSVHLWDVPNGQRASTLSGHAGPIYGVALSADGQLVASASWDRTMRVWNAPDGRLLATLYGHTGGVRSVAFSSDGRLLASGSWDGTVRLWQVPDGRSLATLRGHTGGVRSVAFGADGRLLASGSLDGTVRVWQVPDGGPVSTLAASPNPVYCVALSHDGGLLASGSWDGTICLWDVSGRRLLATLKGHIGEVRGIALNGDASLLASGGIDGTVRLWEVPGGRSLGILGENAPAGDERPSPLFGIAMSPDGGLLTSGSFDGAVRVWDVATGTCRRILRSDRPYERADITGLTGVTAAQRAALLTLGAVDRSEPVEA